METAWIHCLVVSKINCGEYKPLYTENVYLTITYKLWRFTTMEELSDSFFADIRKTKVGTYEITIPIEIIRFEKWKKGETLKLMGRRVRVKRR